jgi:hypothetical protein
MNVNDLGTAGAAPETADDESKEVEQGKIKRGDDWAVVLPRLHPVNH